MFEHDEIIPRTQFRFDIEASEDSVYLQGGLSLCKDIYEVTHGSVQ